MIDPHLEMEAAWECDPLLAKKEGRLGKGSSGDVYLAVESGRKMALKIVPITLKGKDTQKLLQQLKDLYTSHHPNITAFHGAQYDQKGSSILIAFEYCDLKSLKDLLAKVTTLPEDVMGNCTLQVVRGLRYLHAERRIIHRDIKPNNVLVNSKGQFKITDFGMSKELSSTLSAGQTWIGTNSYMSPERVGGLDYTFNADVWSLGLLVYQCCTALPPYLGTNTFELLDQIVDGTPPCLPKGQFSNEAVDFVSLCLKKSHNERPDCDYLITHPFLKKYRNVNVADWLRQAGPG
eukprot:CAMPEP_0206253710 /NCGR_PEP_ID=MMETSP0047_2-20121206/23299_1 /ASSEMBLY_ACC=CAM_ASM_000192 /TAXON_ID=195065 /ORGANISM="Chroomonas mesostigmatica_cf, Strain CCMP1168" /LENGTH=290 /DNA_ID=CAMNT_0053679941 /DNA_START=248 /DNA_END=1116 /DNA_ORIENTATION=-